jgi:hypothetical protein
MGGSVPGSLSSLAGRKGKTKKKQHLYFNRRKKRPGIPWLTLSTPHQSSLQVRGNFNRPAPTTIVHGGSGLPNFSA